LCFCYYKKGEFAEAIAEGERAVSIDPGSVSALHAHAFSLSIGGRPEEGIPIFQKAIRLSPFGPHSLYRDFGFVLRNTGRFEEAVTSFKKAIQIQPDDVTTHYGLTGAYFMMGREEEARAKAAEVRRIDPKYIVGSLAKDFPNKVLSETEKVDIVLRNAALFALTGNALTLRAAGRYNEAIPLFQKAIRLSPGGPSYLSRNLGGALRSAGRFEEAISAFKMAIQIWPDDLSAHTGLTATYSMMGREREARAEAAEVLRINPKFSVDSWVKNLQYKQSEKEKILNALRKAGLK
jgi:tetratricopeptide (TPR) repeat protein